MRMRQPKRSGWTWLIAAWLSTCAVWAIGQEDPVQEPLALRLEAHLESRIQDQTRQIQARLKQLSQQVSNLRSMTTQADRALLQQGQAVQKQVEGLELAQTQLQAQLLALQAESQQQLARLQTTNQQLRQGLWALAGLTALMLVSLVVVWRTRANAGHEPANFTPPGPQSPGNAPTPPGPAGMAGGLSQISPPVSPAASPAVMPQTVTTAAPPVSSPLAIVPTEPEPHTAPDLSTWVAADLDSTAQALAQARAGFMQPVRIDN